MSDVVLNFTLEEFGVRLAKVRAAMEKRELDVLIVHDPSNMAWLTGYDGWSFYVPQCVVIGHSGEPVWFGRNQDANGARRTVYMSHKNVVGYPDHYVMNPPLHPWSIWQMQYCRNTCGIADASAWKKTITTSAQRLTNHCRKTFPTHRLLMPLAW